ncbi:MAG: PQQ-dependent sugar dehydrogenase [Anaerolineales bacterium]|nr:PQQ-dependent sugar dehydrogenase [Anaerolineales bacterium]
MRRLLVPLLLAMFACGSRADRPPITLTPPSPTLTESAPTNAPAPKIESATPAPEATAILNVSQFPNPDDYEWKEIVGGLTRPVDLKSAMDGSGRLFVVEKYGAIRILQDGQLLDQPFLDIAERVNESGNEMGLLGLAFHPNFAENGYFYVNYTGAGGNSRVSRFTANGNFADPSSEKILLTVDQPYENHNGGAVAFGPDGYLYLSFGDGGSQGDPNRNGQNVNALLGKILRIDVNRGDPYSIPADNPFGNEVWAYGLRNPWRISFDRATGDLWIGDVGQNQYEEIDYLPAGSPGGANFGWSEMEGFHDYNGEAKPGLLLPVVEYSHQFGCSVTGGYVYRGAMPEWNGVYFYGDYCSGKVWGIIFADGQWNSQALFDTGLSVTSFGEDEAGELYLLNDYSGGVYRLTKK